MDCHEKDKYSKEISDTVVSVLECLSGYTFDGRIKVRVYDDGGFVCQIHTNNQLPLFQFMMDPHPSDLCSAITAILKASDFWRMSRYEVRLVK